MNYRLSLKRAPPIIGTCFLLFPAMVALSQVSCPVITGCPAIVNGAPSFPTSTAINYTISGTLPAGAAAALANAVATANSFASSLGTGNSFSTSGSDSNFIIFVNSAPNQRNTGCYQVGKVSCNGSNPGAVRQYSIIYVNLAQICNGAACFNPAQSAAFQAGLAAVLTHEFMHDLGAPDVNSNSDIMGNFVGQNDTGNSGKTFSTCDLKATTAIRTLLSTGKICPT